MSLSGDLLLVHVGGQELVGRADGGLDLDEPAGPERIDRHRRRIADQRRRF